MIRTQIQLPPDQHRALKRWAKERGISMSEAVRRCIAAQLEGESAQGGWPAPLDEAMNVIGRYVDPYGPSRVAEDHDEHLDSAYRIGYGPGLPTSLGIACSGDGTLSERVEEILDGFGAS